MSSGSTSGVKGGLEEGCDRESKVVSRRRKVPTTLWHPTFLPPNVEVWGTPIVYNNRHGREPFWYDGEERQEIKR